MKNRIIALILVVVMSLLALCSCGSYDFAEETLDYASFDYAAFKDALGKIEIEDGEFTTDEAIRTKLTAAKIYNAVVDKILAAAKEEERNTSLKDDAKLTAGDVLYFVYYATMLDENGNEIRFFSNQMDKITLTNSDKAKHVIRLGDYFDEKDDAFNYKLLEEVLKNIDSLNPYTISTKSDLEDAFDEQWKADHEGKTYKEVEDGFKADYKTKNPDATETQVSEAFAAFKKEYTDAKKAATRVEEGKTYYVSYTRKYQTPVYEYELDENGKEKLDENGKKIVKKDADGNPVVKKDADGNTIYETVTEKAVYQDLVIDNTTALGAVLLNEKAPGYVGDTAFQAYDKMDGETVKTSSTFTVVDPTADTKVVKEGKYTYSSFAIKWRVDGGTPIVINHTPETKKAHTKDDGTVGTKMEAPSSLYKDGEKIDLVGKSLTYYVFPVYAVDAPAYEEITVNDVLFHIYGSKLTEKSFEALGEDYKNGETLVKDLVKKVAEIFDTKSTTNDYYKEGGALAALNKAYNDAVTAGGSKPSATQQTAIDDAKEALTDKQNELLKGVIADIVAAKNADGKVLGDVIFKADDKESEYYHNNYHSLKEAYDSDITKKVQTKVWELIDEMVKVDLTKLPADLVKDYVDHLYESYEYDFYKGTYQSGSSSSTSTVTNYKHYEGNFNKYLIEKLSLTTKTHLVKDELNKALRAEAEKYLEPIIKIYVVAKACETDALKVVKGKTVLESYVQADIDSGAYDVHEDDYTEELYGDKAAKKLEEAKKNAEENKKQALEEAKVFIIDDAFMKSYKKEVGSVNYNSAIQTYGEINLRAGFQFNKLFYYLTSTNIALNEDGDHVETVYKDGKLDFRTVSYSIIVDTETDAQ